MGEISSPVYMLHVFVTRWKVLRLGSGGFKLKMRILITMNVTLR